MPLHPKQKEFLDSIPKPVAGYTPTAQEQRENFKRVIVPLEERPPINSVEDRTIPSAEFDIPIRIYTPEGDGPFPIYVYFHGGGFIMGSIETHDINCRRIANDSGCKVISVEYRLAPEHPFPAAPNDCFAAVKWISENAEMLGGDPNELAVGGDSAGGNLATVVCLMAREKNGPAITKQILAYPGCDFKSNETLYPSIQENGSGYGLDREAMVRTTSYYLQNPSDADNPYASPIRANDLSGLPPALILTAEYDPLRDEGESYAAMLKEAGVPVELKRYEGVLHGFLFHTHGELEQSNDAYSRIASFLKK